MNYIFVLLLSSAFLKSTEQKQCDACILENPSLNYCFDPEYPSTRCATKEKLKYCKPQFIEGNSKTTYTVLTNKNVREFEEIDKLKSHFQLKPQHLNVKLRKGETINITFSYKPAPNYPLDVYYLMDLTMSMRQDLQTIVNLGGELGSALEQITTNFKLGFGSYADKFLLPFSLTNQLYLENPCPQSGLNQCAPTYLFRHVQNFTDDVDIFKEQVANKSKITANIDNLEGGMEALMQVILCGDKLGWSNMSRKLVIISTGGFMHLAGDGKLGGATQRNTNRCMVDFKGEYPANNSYDYPSLGEIFRKLKEHKINVIFAVKNEVEDYYQQLKTILGDYAYVGTLKKDSSNIIELTKSGYDSFSKQAEFSVDQNRKADLRIKFYVDCDGYGFVKSNQCNNVRSGNEIKVIAEIRLKGKEEVLEETLFISEKNIHENIQLDMEYIGFCQCTGPDIGLKCAMGYERCGYCVCDIGWTGKTCNETCNTDITKCRNVVNGTIESSCSRRGECICEKCECDFPYSGKFCEIKCPTYRNQICSKHGQCVANNVCKCNPGFSGKYCSCMDGTGECTVFGKICNEHGTCKCNKCECEKGYRGYKCEYSIKKNDREGLCRDFKKAILARMVNGTKIYEFKNVSIRIVILDSEVPLKGVDPCFERYTNITHQCDINFDYIVQSNMTTFHVKSTCYKLSYASGTIPVVVVITIVLLGLIALGLWKCVVTRRDRIEYARFEKNAEANRTKMETGRQHNPLYNSPIVKYTVPSSTD